MLVLARMRDESIVIDDDIKITVVDIRGDKVRLGVDAPSCLEVHRYEIWDRAKKSKYSVKTLISQLERFKGKLDNEAVKGGDLSFLISKLENLITEAKSVYSV